MTTDEMLKIKRQPVESSNIAAIGYDEENKVLVVEFNNSTIYSYLNVPENIYHDLISASSIGSYFAKNVRMSFTYERLT